MPSTPRRGWLLVQGGAALLVFALAVASVALRPASPSAEDGSVECVVPGGREVRILLRGEGAGATLAVGPAGEILVAGGPCFRATVTNVDLIVALGGEGHQALTIDLEDGAFAPGLTPEDDGPEVEMEVSLGPDEDRLTVQGSDGPDGIVLGDGGLNLNVAALPPEGLTETTPPGSDTTAPDADLRVRDVEVLEARAGDGEDLVSAAGGEGTGDPHPTAVLLDGGPGADGMAGGGADDLLGGHGADVLHGGDGPDVLDGEEGSDELDGGRGIDLADYRDAAEGVEVDLRDAAAAEDGHGAADELDRVEQVGGSAFGDELAGGTGDDELRGGQGDDVLSGSPGDDRLQGGSGSDAVDYGGLETGVDVDLAAGEASDDGQDGTDALGGIEEVIGSGGADVIAGDGGRNTLAGGPGADVVAGGGAADSLSGGDGVDVLTYEDAPAGVTANLRRGDARDDGTGAIDSLGGFERVIGSAFDDALVGDSFSNLLRGGTGADRIAGGVGSDRLEGGPGPDDLDGGPGTDTCLGGEESDRLDRCEAAIQA